MRPKKLLILGGSVNAIQILETAHSMGHEVGVVDYYENSKCKSLAEYAHTESVFNIDAVVDIVRSNKYDGVLTGYSEQLLPVYAQICDLTGLNCYGSKELFEISTDKIRFKELCEKYGVPIMKTFNYDEVVNDNSQYPIVVKPVDSSASIGVSICHSPGDFKEKYQYALEASKKKSVIIEKCSLGKEATFFYYFVDGNVFLTAFGDRLTFIPPNQRLPMPVGYIFPADVSDEAVISFNSKLSTLFRNEGFRSGMAFAQVFIENGQIFMNEIGYRLTPSFETFAIESLYGFNPINALINNALDIYADNSALKNLNPFSGHAANVTLLLNNGKIASYRGLDEVARLPYVIKVLPAWEVGHEVMPSHIGTLAQVGIRVIIKGDSRSQIIEHMEKIKESISVFDCYGNEMLIKNYSYNDIAAL